MEPLTAKVNEAFRRRVADGQPNPLFWALHESFRFEFWLGGLCALIGTVLQVISPFTLRYLIQFASDAYVASIEGGPAPPIAHGVGLVIGITIMQVLQSFCVSHFIFRGMMLGGQTRGVLIGMIYEKAMVISGRAKAGGSRELLLPAADGQDEEHQAKDETDEKANKKKAKKAKKDKRGKKGPAQKDGIGWANGRIVNLMSVDTYRIDQASALFHMTWTSPIACLITLVVLLINLTYSALAGFALLVIGVPALTLAIRSLFRRRKAINKVTDQRVSLTQEILQAVRFVKYFGWEEAFIGRLAEIRSKEIHAIQILLAIRNAINAVSMSLPIFASMLSFIAYSLSNHALAPAQVFSSLALFNGLRIPLNLLPLVLGQVTDAGSSLKRIEEYLVEEELEEDVINKPDGENAIEMHNASFTWERTPTQDPDKGTIAGGEKGKKSAHRDGQGRQATRHSYTPWVLVRRGYREHPCRGARTIQAAGRQLHGWPKRADCRHRHCGQRQELAARISSRRHAQDERRCRLRCIQGFLPAVRLDPEHDAAKQHHLWQGHGPAVVQGGHQSVSCHQPLP